MSQKERFREALAVIAEVTNSLIDEKAVAGTGHAQHDHSDGSCADCPKDAPACLVKALPTRLLVKAAMTARAINPLNAPLLGPQAALAIGSFQVDDPQFIAVKTSKYWGPQLRQLKVSFMEATPPNLKARIIMHLNAWSACCGISFVGTDGVGDVRISRGPGGYWSYLGTDILHIPKNRPTMNLENFSMSTPESEYKRVVRHEAGHTLGFPHEHMRKALVDRIDPAKAYVWFLQTYGWDKATVDAQVLTPLSESELLGTPPDQTSIMCYQLPARITKDGLPIAGGLDINTTDCSFAKKIYPKAGRAQVSAEFAGESDDAQEMQLDDWPESEDVEVYV